MRAKKKVCVSKMGLSFVALSKLHSPPRGNHLEERLLDQAQAWALYPPPPLLGSLRSILQGMVSDVQPLVKSSFEETN